MAEREGKGYTELQEIDLKSKPAPGSKAEGSDDERMGERKSLPSHGQGEDGGVRQDGKGGGGGGEKKKEDEKKKPFNWKRLLALAYPERFMLIAGTIGLVVSSAMTLLVLGMVGSMVDTFNSGDAEESIAKLNDTVIKLLLLFVVGSGFTFMRAALFTIAGERVVTRLRGRLFKSLIEQDIAFFDENRTGELVSRIADDCGVLQNSVTTNISMVLRQMVQLFGSLVIILVISWRLTAVMLLVVPILSFSAVFYGRWLKTISKKMQDAVAAATDVAQENLSNVRTVRSFSGEERSVRAYNEKLQESFAIARKRGVAYGVFTSGMFFAGNIALVAVLHYGGTLVITGVMSVGELMSFVLYTAWIAAALGILTSVFNDFMKSIGASQRVFELLDRMPAIPPSESGPQTESTFKADVEFSSVCFSYPSRPNVAVLDNVSLNIAEGATVALVGPSGGGKSTVVALVQRFYDPLSGSVKIGGADLRSVDRAVFMRHIASVMQEPVLFATTIRANIVYGLQDGEEPSPDKIEECARSANAWEFITRFADGLDTAVGERGVRLSGGQKQRIAIARALMKRPKLLILDEATSALDSESEALVQAAIDSLIAEHNRTTLVIAHRLSTVRNADKILVISGGGVAQQGTHDELLAQGGVYAQLVAKQIHGGAVAGTAEVADAS